MPTVRITDQFKLFRRRDSKVWYLVWFEKGQRQRRSTGAEQLAEARLAARELILKFATLDNEKPTTMPVDVVIDRYMAQHGEKLASKSTAIVAANLWKQFWKGHTVADMTVAKLEAFGDWLFDRGYSNNYVRRVLGVGRAALNRAHRRQELSSVPFVQLPEKGEPFFHVATLDQIAKFLNALTEAESYLFVYCMIRLNTGCRGDAARDLQPFQVDFVDNIVRLNPPGRKQTKKYRPVVPLTSALATYLKTLAPQTYYVARPSGKHLGSVRKSWGAVRKRAELPIWFSPKVLRHTVATELRRRGVPGWEVSGLLGHSTTEASRTTEIYAKYDPEFLSKARVAIDSWMRELAAKVPQLEVLMQQRSNVVAMRSAG